MRLTKREITKRIRALEAQYGRDFTRQLREIVNTLTSNASITDLIAAIEAGNSARVLDVLNIHERNFGSLGDIVRNAFASGGALVATSFPAVRNAAGIRAFFTFDVRNSRAEEWIATQSSNLITRTTNAMRDAVRVKLNEALVSGSNPRVTALDIVGRIDPVSKTRVGGIIGLNGPQTQWLNNARNELKSTNAVGLSNYLARTQRDKRFDSHVRKALKTGKPIPAETASRMITRYSDNLLRLRGETIGRVESLTALNRSQWEAYTQAQEQGIVKRTSKVWSSAGDARVRDTHAEIDGTSVDLNQPFTLSDGSSMMFPLDSSMGAAADQIINCRCITTYTVDFFEGVE